MFETGAVLLQPHRVAANSDTGHPGSGAGFDAPAVAGWVAALGSPNRGATDGERIDQIAALERLKSAATAAQAVLTADFAASQRAAQRAAGVPADRVGRGIAAQIAMARRDSHFRGGRHLGLARALVEELPATMAALRTGDISEWRATVICRETACLDREQRTAADAELAARPGGLAALGDRQAEAETRKIAYRLDPHAFMARIRGAEADRRVTLRPAPDTMARLTGFLPVANGVAAYAALTRHADTLRASGDPRSRGQIMADTLYERVTGQAATDGPPVEVQLIMTDTALLGSTPGQPDSADTAANRYDAVSGTDGDDLADETLTSTDDITQDDDATDDPLNDDATEEGFADQVSAADVVDATREAASADGAVDRRRDEPAFLVGIGPIPAPMARDWIRDTDAPVWLRRLYTRPHTGELIAMTSHRRRFPKPLRGFLILRDQICRTPWCGAPIRHADHAVPVEAGGETSEANGEGLCEACNLAKQAPGFRARPGPSGAGKTVTITTPTGHSYTSHAPPPPGAPLTTPPSATGHPDSGPADRQHVASQRDELRRQVQHRSGVLERHLRLRYDAA